jgi:hypothetical protein
VDVDIAYYFRFHILFAFVLFNGWRQLAFVP